MVTGPLSLQRHDFAWRPRRHRLVVRASVQLPRRAFAPQSRPQVLWYLFQDASVEITRGLFRFASHSVAFRRRGRFRTHRGLRWRQLRLKEVFHYSLQAHTCFILSAVSAPRYIRTSSSDPTVKPLAPSMLAPIVVTDVPEVLPPSVNPIFCSKTPLT